MEELLLPNGEEEARSNQSSFALGGARETIVDRIRNFLQEMMNGNFRKTLNNFIKRNGLLTLSVIAVLTGCILGFMLRGSQLSTQVCNPFSDCWWVNDLVGGNVFWLRCIISVTFCFVVGYEHRHLSHFFHNIVDLSIHYSLHTLCSKTWNILFADLVEIQQGNVNI